MHPQRRPSRPRARSWLPGLLALAAASCEADRYPVGADGVDAGPPGAAAPGDPPVPPAPPAAPAPSSCQLAGAPMPERPVTISAFQLAERLSRFVWAAPADAAFLQEVTRLAPGTTTQVATLAREMLDDPRADAGVQAFYRKWLGRAAAPRGALGLDAALWTAMGRETDAFVAYLTRYGGNLADLLQVPFSFLDSALGQHYGVAVSGPELRRVDLDPAQRTGLLTQASWLISKPTPSERGLWVINGLFCHGIALPPVDKAPLPPDPAQATLTTRERLERATSPAACMPCHRLIDPPGFLYENYDSAGRYREVEAGQVVNASAEVDLPGFEARLEKAAGLARSAVETCDVQSCFARHWLSAAAGREVDDAAELAKVTAAFRASRLSLREILVVVVQSRPFVEP